MKKISRVTIEINGQEFNLYDSVEVTRGYLVSYSIPLILGSIFSEYIWYVVDEKAGVDLFDSILIACGHNINKIDRAVPSTWSNDYYKRNLKYPSALWSYENSIMGEPLFVSDVLANFRALVRERLLPIIYESVKSVHGVEV